MAALNEEAFAAWAPDASPWSVWAKPVLFAQGSKPPSMPAPAAVETDPARYPGPEAGTALVLDLPDRSAVVAGLGLAQRGFRPVPLYNSCAGVGCLVNVVPIMDALSDGVDALSRMQIPDDAPPAFLLDSERMKGDPQPGRFDNRWMVFPQDFPSAAFLRSLGIRRVILVQQGDSPREDLAHVLLRWQKGGVELAIATPEMPDASRFLEVKPPSRFRRAWYRALAAMGLRRGNVGGFGALVPVATASSG